MVARPSRDRPLDDVMKVQHIMDEKATRQAKTEKPHGHFDDPQQVVADPALSKQDKLKALETLEQDARLLATEPAADIAGVLTVAPAAKRAAGNASATTIGVSILAARF
jgi:hypothetical protein